MRWRTAVAALCAIPFLQVFALPADLATSSNDGSQWPSSVAIARTLTTYRGSAAVIDGRTLWFPDKAVKVRLAGIDACELPQWAFDPTWRDRERLKAPAPVPCGPFAKAWLKRTVGTKGILCKVQAYEVEGTPQARCLSGGKDIALEMIRVGWARVEPATAPDPLYLSLQRYAMAARYGMWATYVLDMNEWRDKAVDKTLSRRPIADFNLLSERKVEISPPFADARKKPRRTDR
ncbi:MAG: thermonuclease family protein [Mesorhizobium sp.]|uniref:thermonuclease family protein n=1 Tax=Mesorhizobium sp. TaxID=1871066 RepID=UPI000FE72191|nr:thermonuclease family protein [Mesorhizobium sp.]RWM06660.1 MAG: thermonuclease family protein [Mesorhizobium sp.]